jgi:hypothetical protein
MRSTTHIPTCACQSLPLDVASPTSVAGGYSPRRAGLWSAAGPLACILALLAGPACGPHAGTLAEAAAHLKSPDPELRRRAAEDIRDIADEHPPESLAEPILKALACENDPKVQRELLLALGSTGAPAAKAIINQYRADNGAAAKAGSRATRNYWLGGWQPSPVPRNVGRVVAPPAGAARIGPPPPGDPDKYHWAEKADAMWRETRLKRAQLLDIPTTASPRLVCAKEAAPTKAPSATAASRQSRGARDLGPATTTAATSAATADTTAAKVPPRPVDEASRYGSFRIRQLDDDRCALDFRRTDGAWTDLFWQDGCFDYESAEPSAVRAVGEVSFPHVTADGQEFHVFSVPTSRGGNMCGGYDYWVVVVSADRVWATTKPLGGCREVADARVAEERGVTSLVLIVPPTTTATGATYTVQMGEVQTSTQDKKPRVLTGTRRLAGVGRRGLAAHAAGNGIMVDFPDGDYLVDDTSQCVLGGDPGWEAFIELEIRTYGDGGRSVVCLSAVPMSENAVRYVALCKRGHAYACVGACRLTHDKSTCEASCRSGIAEACKETCSESRSICNALCRKGTTGACEYADEASQWVGKEIQCSKGASVYCLAVAEHLAPDYETASPAAIAKAVAAYRRACDAGFPKACNNLGILYANGRGMPRDYALARQYTDKACKRSSDPIHCANARGAACTADTIAPARRRPQLDPWCNPIRGKPGHGARRAYSGAVPTMRIEYDDCFEALRVAGCTGANIATQGASVFCCK